MEAAIAKAILDNPGKFAEAAMKLVKAQGEGSITDKGIEILQSSR